VLRQHLIGAPSARADPSHSESPIRVIPSRHSLASRAGRAPAGDADMPSRTIRVIPGRADISSRTIRVIPSRVDIPSRIIRVIPSRADIPSRTLVGPWRQAWPVAARGLWLVLSRNKTINTINNKLQAFLKLLEFRIIGSAGRGDKRGRARSGAAVTDALLL
jgi:hypothetical protein